MPQSSVPEGDYVAFAGDVSGGSSIPFWKHGFDLFCIALTCVIWLPVMLLLMAAIRVFSPGPIFFRQARVGYRGRIFMIYKFRSMKVNVETRTHEDYLQRVMSQECPMTKLDAAGDPRLIPLGRLLRASGLDELPQIFNILRGEMSLVGPRPCTVKEFERYEAYQQERLQGLPGLTGHWQVNGKNRTTFSEMIALDIHYVRHTSIWGDVVIIAKTFPTLVSQFLDLWQPAAKPRSQPQIRGPRTPEST